MTSKSKKLVASVYGVALPPSNKRKVWSMVYRGAMAARLGMREGVPGSQSYACHQETLKQLEAIARHFDLLDALHAAIIKVDV